MNNQVYDIAVVGGGLAGLSLAIQGADKGFKVVLFEKEEYPFHKVCGEYISMESWHFLLRLGLDLTSQNLPLIKTLVTSDVSGKNYTFKLPLGGFGISRYTLDNQLYVLALTKGVNVVTATKVQNVTFKDDLFLIDTSNGHFTAKVAAGSFGKRSNLDVKWKRDFIDRKNKSLNNYIGIKYHIKYNHDPNCITLHNFKNGYCGMSKIEKDKSCLCYLTTATNLKNCGNSIKMMESEILCKNPRLKEIFTSAEFIYSEPLAISQISFNPKEQVKSGVLMLGDAAGMISPLCGNGMSMALHSSKIAFAFIAKFLNAEMKREELEKAYTLEWKKTFSKRLWMGRTVQAFFGGELSTAYFLKTMHLLPVLSKKVIESTHGHPF